MFNENLYREEFMCFAEDDCESPQYIPLEDLHDFMCSSGKYSPYPTYHGCGKYDNRFTESPQCDKLYKSAMEQFRRCAYQSIRDIINKRELKRFTTERGLLIQHFWADFKKLSDDVVFKYMINMDHIKHSDELLKAVANAIHIFTSRIQSEDFGKEIKKVLLWKVYSETEALNLIAYIDLLIRHNHINNFKFGFYDYITNDQIVYVDTLSVATKLYKMVDEGFYKTIHPPVVIFLSNGENGSSILPDGVELPYLEEHKQMLCKFKKKMYNAACVTYTETIINRRKNDIIAIVINNNSLRRRHFEFNKIIEYELSIMNL